MTQTLDLDLRITLPIAILGLMIGYLSGVEPKLAILAVMGIAFFVVAFNDLTYGLAGFVFLIFAEGLIPADAGFGLIKLAGLLITVSWFGMLATRDRERAPVVLATSPIGSAIVIAFLVWVVVSVSWSTDLGLAITDMQRFALNVVLLAIVFTAASTRRRLWIVIWSFIISVALSASYGLLIRPPEDPNDLASAASDRLASTVGNANELAAVLIVGMAISLAAAYCTRNGAARAFAIGTAGIALIGLVLTGSRGGLIALGVMMLVATLVGGRWRPYVVAVSATVLVGGGLAFAAFATPEVQDRILQTTPGELRASDEGRSTIWGVGWRMAQDNLGVGVGVGNYTAVSADYVLQPGTGGRSDLIIDEPKSAHNMYLATLAELGVIGLGLFLAVLVFGLSAALRAAHLFQRAGDGHLELVSRALFAGLTGVYVAGFLSSHHFAKWLWLLIGIATALLYIAKRTLPSEIEDQGSASV